MDTTWFFFSEDKCLPRGRDSLSCMLLVLLFSGQNWPLFLMALKEVHKNQDDCVYYWRWEKVWEQTLKIRSHPTYLNLRLKLILMVCLQDCRWLNLSVLGFYSLTLKHHSWPFLNSFCPKWEVNLPMFHLMAYSQVNHDSYMSQLTLDSVLAHCGVH